MKKESEIISFIKTHWLLVVIVIMFIIMFILDSYGLIPNQSQNVTLQHRIIYG